MLTTVTVTLPMLTVATPRSDVLLNVHLTSNFVKPTLPTRVPASGVRQPATLVAKSDKDFQDVYAGTDGSDARFRYPPAANMRAPVQAGCRRPPNLI